ncbi:MAG TPA: hypothetical protein VNR18_08630 [Hyphomicrobiales bacterium]|nr:hypothetical protein [Hyphomicrobiales bacterium]
MSLRRRHKIIGLVLLLPFFAWSCTAAFFLVRPRYEQAYEQLQVHRYPLAAQQLPLQADWEEVRYFQTLLGPHLLVRSGNTWRHLDPATLTPVPQPDQAALTRLLEDAFTANPQRYGHVTGWDGNRATTSTGATVDVNWDTLTLSQQGRDTYWINKVYDVHYLAWTGNPLLDRILGLSGLALLFYMTWTGLQLALGWKLPVRSTAASKPVANARGA